MRTALPIGAALAALLALGACSQPGPPPGQEQAPGQPVTSAPTSTASATTSQSAGATTSASPGSTAGSVLGSPDGGSASRSSDLGPPAATRTSTVGGKPLDLVLFAIVRDGTLARVDFTVAAKNWTPIADAFDDGNTDSSDRSYYTTDGLTLLDTTASKVYLVAADSQGRCLCSRQLVQAQVQGNQPVLLFATFAAPPATVTSMSVQIPGFGVFTGVPVR